MKYLVPKKYTDHAHKIKESCEHNINNCTIRKKERKKIMMQPSACPRTLMTIAEMNTTAVCYFKYGENAKAVPILINALKLITQVANNKEHHHESFMFHPKSQSNHCNPSNIEPQQNTTYESFILHPSIVDQSIHSRSYSLQPSLETECAVFQPQRDSNFTCCSVSSSTSTSSKNSSIYDDMYNRAFLLVDDIPVAIGETAAVVSFNLALIVHREGIRTGQDSTLKKAMAFYKQSYRFLGHGEHQLCYHQSNVLLILTAALFANMNHIENKLFLSQSFDNERASDRMNRLVMLMELSNTIDPDDLFFFQLNVILIKMKTLDIAPAA